MFDASLYIKVANQSAAIWTCVWI